MSRCPECKNRIPFKILMRYSKKRPITCPRCHADRLYIDLRETGKWAMINVPFFVIYAVFFKELGKLNFFLWAAFFIAMYVVAFKLWWSLLSPKLVKKE